MSDHAPITTDLRRAARRFSKFTDLSIEHVELEAGRFDELCDAIDAVHAALEDENDRLREGRSIEIREKSPSIASPLSDAEKDES